MNNCLPIKKMNLNDKVKFKSKFQNINNFDLS